MEIKSNKKFQVRISEIIELKNRFREINDNLVSEIDFLDDDGNTISINQKFIDDWKYTGLNITDFIDSGFYLEGFDNETIKAINQDK